MRGYSFTPHRGSGYIVAAPQSFNFWLASPSSHLRSLAGALRVVPHTRCAVVRERGLSSGRVGLATGGYLGLKFCRLLELGLGWLGDLRHFRGALRPSRHSSRGLPTGSAIRCHSSPSCAGAYDSEFVDPRLLDVATGGVWDSFVLLPRILGCWGPFARAFLHGRLVIPPPKVLLPNVGGRLDPPRRSGQNNSFF